MSEEFIIDIEEVIGVGVDVSEYANETYDGYRIKTNRQDIMLLIDDGQQCCEDWGYFWTNDNIQEFIFRKLLEIRVTDKSLDTRTLDDIYIDEGHIMFIDLVTDYGTLQFTAYNAHNGYYSHHALIVSKQLTRSEVL